MIEGVLYKWKINDLKSDHECVQKLSIDLNISIPVATVLYNRGFKNKEEVYNFLFPDYDPKKYHTSYLKDSLKAAARIIKAIENKERILICGDYDVDGITATSLLLCALTECGANVNFFLPNRVIDGYGLSKKVIERAHKSGYTLLITVDNGISAFEALEHAGKINLDVIVTDHHHPPDPLPQGAFCIVNPHQIDCPYPFKELAGVGVAFKMAQLLYEHFSIPLSLKIYELFLFGTIADVVPLVDENRYWIMRILKMIEKKSSHCLSVLKQNGKIATNKILSASDIAFSCAPQINALGRLEDPRQGVYFLISTDEKEIEEIGFYLLGLNKKRRDIEQDHTTALHKQLQKEGYNAQEHGCVIRASKDYTPGIIGLIAARTCQTYGVPTCIFSENNEGILKGSCRSIPECNIIECLEDVDKALLLSFGGHAGAAGLSLKKENLELFFEQFSRAVKKRCSLDDLQQKIIIDSVLTIDDLNKKLWDDLQLLEPYGASNQTPLFCVYDLFLKDVTLLKDAHVKLIVQKDTFSSSVIFFNKPDLFNILKDRMHEKIHVAGRITNNVWNNTSKIEIIGQDIAF